MSFSTKVQRKCFDVSFWRQDRHFTCSFQPREGLAVCRAKEVPSWSWVMIRPGNQAHDLPLCIQTLYKLITCFCHCDICPAKTYSKMMTDITFSRRKDRGFTQCGAHYLWLRAECHSRSRARLRIKRFPITYCNALRRVDTYVKHAKTRVGKFEYNPLGEEANLGRYEADQKTQFTPWMNEYPRPFLLLSSNRVHTLTIWFILFSLVFFTSCYQQNKFSVLILSMGWKKKWVNNVMAFCMCNIVT